MARKILLADDSVTAQNMGRRILSDAGYDVVTVNNGSAALKKIAEHKPDLIVLDVYMPGYGGLEVCQRLKENSETARIPVLLSVGKLEPFKAEEARRVRADGYIVKPFEASELLTALTKLEDKIVPQAEPYKPGRFAKAIAAVESEKADAFGDAETGWKERLKVTRKGAKPAEPETAEIQEFPGSGRKKGSKPGDQKAGVEIDTPAVLPKDITAEELAAITAAAAAFGNEKTDSTPTQQTAAEEALNSAPALSPIQEPETAGLTEQAKPQTEQMEIAGAEAPTATFASAPDENVAAEPRREASDAEVLAALATLSPEHREGEETSSALGTGSESIAAGVDFSGPRWVASSIALSLEESTLVLEREMDKARAAIADLEAGGPSLAGAPLEAPPSSTAGESLANEEPDSRREESPAETPAAEVSETKLPEPEPVAAMEANTEAEPEEFDVAADEAEAAPAAALEAVATPVSNATPEDSPEAAIAVAASAETTSDSAIPPEESMPAQAVSEITLPAKEETAYVAAAAAGAGSSETLSAQLTSHPATMAESVVNPPALPEEQRQRETELAAAWASWKQIRETAVGQELTSQVADVAAREFKEIRREETSAHPQAETPNASAHPDAIASIVDSVLAQLKPKLVEEIAKKMAADKKE